MIYILKKDAVEGYKWLIKVHPWYKVMNDG